MQDKSRDDQRIDSLEAFDNTKMEEISSVKVTAEYVQNKDRGLTVLLNTFVHLHLDLGPSFHFGNFDERNRYIELVVDPFLTFVLMIVDKLQSLDYGGLAKKVLENKAEIIDYLSKNNWTV